MPVSTNPAISEDQPTRNLRRCADDFPITAAARLQDKLDSNIDRLKADAAFVLEEEADDQTRELIELGCSPEQPDEEMWWRIGYYLGLLRGTEILED
jgi:hypothetical protein